MGLRLEVTPTIGGEQVVGFGIQYHYTNTVFALGKEDYFLFQYLAKQQQIIFSKRQPWQADRM